jgi:AmmeMemoRadiSam system protein A
VLLSAARDAIAEALGLAVEGLAAPPCEPDLLSPGSSFVTLTLEGRLRGCVGSLSFNRPLLEDVRDNAVAAALRDRRFPPLAPVEFARVRVEVSVLRPPEPLPACASLEEAASGLCRGSDGVVLESGWARGVFLPQVWESLPEPREFLRQLRRKAGLGAGGWEAGIRLWRFSVEKWCEESAGG